MELYIVRCDPGVPQNDYFSYFLQYFYHYFGIQYRCKVELFEGGGVDPPGRYFTGGVVRSKSRIGVQRVACSSGALRSMSTLGEELLETPLFGTAYAAHP